MVVVVLDFSRGACSTPTVLFKDGRRKSGLYTHRHEYSLLLRVIAPCDQGLRVICASFVYTAFPKPGSDHGIWSNL